MSTCTLADPGVAAGWPPLMGADPFGRVVGVDPDPLLGSLFDLVPIYNNAHSFVVSLGDTLPAGAGLSWDSVDPTILVHTGTLLRGALDLDTGVNFRFSNAGIVNTEIQEVDPTLATDPEMPHSGTLSCDTAVKGSLDNYVLYQPSGGAMKNLMWRVKIDPAGVGNFTLTMTSLGNFGKSDGTGTTAPIPVGASLATVQAAIQALPFVGFATGHPTRPNITVKGSIGDYTLTFDDGAFHDEIYIVSMSSTGPVLSITSQPGVFGGEGSAFAMVNTQNLVVRKLLLHNFLADGPKTGGTCYDIGFVNSTIRAHPGRAGFGGHNDGLIPRALDNTGAVTGRTKRYFAELCFVEMWSGNAAVYMAGFQTVQGTQGVIVKRCLLKGPNKAVAQNGVGNHSSGASDCWVDSTQINDSSARDEGGAHGRSSEYVWQNCRRSDATGSDPRGTPVPPHSPDPGVLWMPEPAGYVSLCLGGGGGDVTPPSVPTGLAATPIVGASDFTWNPSTDT